MAVARPAIIVACLVVLTFSACNQREAVLDTPVGPTATVPPPPGVASVSVSPAVVDAGGGVLGTVHLTGPAADPGLDVLVMASDDAAVLQPVVRVPAGAERADFQIATRVVPNDRDVTITAVAADRSVTTRFRVWAEVPIFFKWVSEPGDSIGRGDAEHFTPPTSRFIATCDRNTVSIQVEEPGPRFWSILVGGGVGVPLRPGTYEDASSIPNTSRPFLRVAGRGRGCGSAAARFVVHDIDLRNNRVNRFHASFTQRCESNHHDGQLTGEVRVFDMPPSTSVVTCQR